MTNTDIGMRIFNTRKERGLTLTDIAESTGLAVSTIQRYEAGKIGTIKIPSISAIANALDVNPEWLIGTSEEKEPKKPKKMVRVPVLGRIPAGIPLDAIQEIEDYEEMDYRPGDFFALKVRGDSMHPTISNGDIVIFKQQEDCESGKICAVRINGDDATLKKVIKKGSSVILMPMNPNYSPLVFTDEEIRTIPVQIIGVAVQIRRNL